MKTYLFGYKSKQTSKRRGLKTVSVGEDAVEGAPNVLVWQKGVANWGKI